MREIPGLLRILTICTYGVTPSDITLYKWRLAATKSSNMRSILQPWLSMIQLLCHLPFLDLYISHLPCPFPFNCLSCSSSLHCLCLTTSVTLYSVLYTLSWLGSFGLGLLSLLLISQSCHRWAQTRSWLYAGELNMFVSYMCLPCSVSQLSCLSPI